MKDGMPNNHDRDGARVRAASSQGESLANSQGFAIILISMSAFLFLVGIGGIPVRMCCPGKFIITHVGSKTQVDVEFDANFVDEFELHIQIGPKGTVCCLADRLGLDAVL